MAAAQGTCLNPMAAIAAAQMQQMAAFNVSGLVAAPLTPSSGTTTLPPAAPRWPRGHSAAEPPSPLPRPAGTSTPPGISTAPVPSIATPIGVNGFSPLPPQTNGQPTSETIYTNGIHPYPGTAPRGSGTFPASAGSCPWLSLCLLSFFSLFSSQLKAPQWQIPSSKPTRACSTMQVSHLALHFFSSPLSALCGLGVNWAHVTVFDAASVRCGSCGAVMGVIQIRSRVP